MHITRMLIRYLIYVFAALFFIVLLILFSTRILSSVREQDIATEIAPEHGQYVQTKSGYIFVQSYGPGPGQPILLVHGTAAWSGLWKETSVFLARLGFKVYALDLPPFGFSDRSPTDNYSRSAQARRIIESLKALKIKNTIIVGHSFGSGAAVESVMEAPEMFSGLVLIDAALGLKASEKLSELPLMLKVGWLREMIVSSTVTNPMATKYLLASLLYKKERALPEYVKILQKPMTIKGSTAAVSNWLPYLFRAEIYAKSAKRNQYGLIRIPVGIIWGAEDSITPIDQARDLQSLIKRASLTILSNVGHIPQIENPELFQESLGVLLKKIIERVAL